MRRSAGPADLILSDRFACRLRPSRDSVTSAARSSTSRPRWVSTMPFDGQALAHAGEQRIIEMEAELRAFEVGALAQEQIGAGATAAPLSVHPLSPEKAIVRPPTLSGRRAICRASYAESESLSLAPVRSAANRPVRSLRNESSARRGRYRSPDTSCGRAATSALRDDGDPAIVSTVRRGFSHIYSSNKNGRPPK